ncbi:DUF4440 domain-containing protein [Acidobacteria bacterium AH-259-L09]|nr:DUF4440 domain-containing protein [Acidobacteria bacterium AH-259-L09]
MRSITILSLISFVVCLGACAPAEEEPVEEATTREADVEAINKLAEEYTVAFNAGDSATIVGLFANDGVLMPPDAPVRAGNQAIESWYQTRFDQFTIEQSISPEETEVAGDWGFGRGTYKSKFTPKDAGEAIDIEGKYIAILGRQPNGSWKITRLIWNRNNPAPGQ